MLDDLRNSVSTDYSEDVISDEKIFEEHPGRSHGPFLGMTAAQRFVVALFLFLMVAIIGVFLLIVFQKVYPSF